MQDWQPIDRVPRDGRFVLLCAVGWTKATIGRWERHWWYDEAGEAFHLDERPEVWMPLPDPPEVPPMTKSKEARVPEEPQKCLGCGHRLDRHRPYLYGGRNRHGCALVCIADNCQLWRECRTEESPEVPR